MLSRIITTREEFAALQPAWNRLAAKCGGSPFDLWEWSFSAAETILPGSAELFLVVMESGKDLVAVAPLCIRPAGLGPFRGRALRFIGDAHADYASFLLHPEHNHHALLKRILAILFENRERWDVLHFLNFSSRNPQTWLLSEIAEAEHRALTVYGERVVTPYLRFEDGSSKLDSGEARNLRRRERNLARDHAVEVSVGGPFDEEFWQAFVEFHLARWPESILREEANRRFFRNLIPRFEASGNLELSRLRIDGRLAALHFGFRTPQKIAYYIPVYDPALARSGVGGILLKHIIEHYSGTVGEFDFLRGNEPYKYFWTDAIAANHDIIVDNATPAGRAMRLLLGARMRLRRVSWLMRPYLAVKGLLRPGTRSPKEPLETPASSAASQPAEEPVAG